MTLEWVLVLLALVSIPGAVVFARAMFSHKKLIRIFNLTVAEYKIYPFYNPSFHGMIRVIIASERGESPSPPRSAKLLLLMIPMRDREHLVGDLEETYQTVVLPEYGTKIARIWFWWQAVLAVVPFVWEGMKRLAGLALFLKIIR